MLRSSRVSFLARVAVVSSAAVVSVATSPVDRPTWVQGRHDVTLDSPDGQPATTVVRVVTEGHPRRLSGRLGLAAVDLDAHPYPTDAGPPIACRVALPDGSEFQADTNRYYGSGYVPIGGAIDLDTTCAGASPCSFDLTLRCEGPGVPFDRSLELMFGYSEVPVGAELPPGALSFTEVTP